MSPEPEKEPKPLPKTLRMMKAVLRTTFDPQTKHLLNVYAFHLNDKRPDWDVWSGQESLSRETGLSVDVIARIQTYALSLGVLRNRPPHVLKKRAEAKKRKGGRPSRCFAMDIERVESLGHHEVTLRDSRSKKRLADRQDKIRERLMTIAHGDALRADLARTIRGIRRRYPIVNGKRQTQNYSREIEQPIHEATWSLVRRDPELFARGTRHADLIRKAERQRAREEE